MANSDPVYTTLGTRGFSSVRQEFSVLTETGNHARKVSGTQGMFTEVRKNFFTGANHLHGAMQILLQHC